MAIAYHYQKRMEYLLSQKGFKSKGFSDDLLWPVYTCFNFWALVDEHDSAQSIEKG